LWVFGAGLAAFVVFAVVNRGVAVGDRAMSPSSSLYLENAFFALFLFFLLFLPVNLSHWPQVRGLLNKRGTRVALILLLAAYLLSFVRVHPYNQVGRDFFVRNYLFQGFTGDFGVRLLLFVPVAYAALSLAVAEMQREEFRLLYPFALLSLLPCWMVEPRYYLAPYAFFLLFRKRKSDFVEAAQIAVWIAVSAVMLYGARRRLFFW
jgi:hypothetical protein